MKKILYVDMDNVLVDFESGIARILPEERELYAGRLDEVPFIFSKMDPLEKAIESYEILSRHFDTYILSTSPWENPTALADKLDWVKKHLGHVAHKRLIFSHHKNLNRGDYLIDDRTRNGAAEFTGMHIHFGTPDFPDWDAVMRFLLPEKG